MAQAVAFGSQAKIQMISKHRNRAIVQLVFAAVVTVLLVVLFKNHGRHMTNDFGLIVFFSLLGMTVLWSIGGFSLAQAKGYDFHTMGGAFIFLFIAGFCVPIARFLFPLVVMFGLPDKTAPRRRRRRRSSAEDHGVQEGKQ
jgi:hypothetical protein